MKKTNYLIILILTILLDSCGGTIGNIERYRFYGVSIDSLKSAVKQVHLKHPEFRQYDTVKYKEGLNKLVDGDYYCTISHSEKKYFFMYAFVDYAQEKKAYTDIALSSAAEYGQILYLAKNISSSDKKKFRGLFQQHFINALRNELNYHKSND